VGGGPPEPPPPPPPPLLALGNNILASVTSWSLFKTTVSCGAGAPVGGGPSLERNAPPTGRRGPPPVAKGPPVLKEPPVLKGPVLKEAPVPKGAAVLAAGRDWVGWDWTWALAPLAKAANRAAVVGFPAPRDWGRARLA